MTTEQLIDATNTVYPKWNFTVMFLRALYKSSLSDMTEYQKNVYQKILGNLKQRINGFIENDFIENPTFFDCLSNAMTVADLKNFLKSKSAKVSGNKNDLMLKVANFLTEDEKRKVEEDYMRYRLTSKGWDLINSDRERFAMEYQVFEEKIANKILQDEVEAVYNNIAIFYTSYPFPIGMGTSWKEGIPKRIKDITSHLLKSEYLTDTLDFPEVDRKKIRAIIAVNYLLSFSGFSSIGISEKILLTYPEFKCSAVTKFLGNKPTGVFESYDSQNINQIIEVFNHAIIFEATNKIDFDSCMENISNNWIKGVSILSGKKECRVCKGETKNYTWAQINSIPKLPHYPGCICNYVAFIPR